MKRTCKVLSYWDYRELLEYGSILSLLASRRKIFRFRVKVVWWLRDGVVVSREVGLKVCRLMVQEPAYTPVYRFIPTVTPT